MMRNLEKEIEVRKIILSLIVNFLISWTLLPLLIPPFRLYSLKELFEVLLWQGIGMIGWPLALLGSFLSFLFQFEVADIVTFLLILIYPNIWLLLFGIWRSKRFTQQALVMLHFLLTISYAIIWFQVLNGYEFMVG